MLYLQDFLISHLWKKRQDIFFETALMLLLAIMQKKLDTSSAKFQAEAGVVDFTGDEETIANGIRQLVSILPANNETEAFADCEDDLNRVCADMAAEIADPALALSDISDDNLFVEVKAEFAKEMVTGFIQVDGSTIRCSC